MSSPLENLYFNMLIFIFVTLLHSTRSGLNNMNMRDGVSTAEIINGDSFFQITEPSELRYTYRIRPARDFGGHFNESFCLRNVKLVPMDPLNGCTSPFNDHHIEGNVAFAVRGTCSFLHKTLVAEQAGAQAIIITMLEEPEEKYSEYSELPDLFIEMIDDKSDGDPKIPSAFLVGRSGGQILRTLSRLHMPYGVINIPVNMTHISIHKMNQPPWISL